MKNCLIIAGEKSGEEHVLSFLPQLQKLVPQVHFWGVGGDQMAAAGVELLYHLQDFSSWGYSEVVRKIPFYFRALNKIKKEAVSRSCQVAILVDFQEFNLKLAQGLAQLGVAVLYYVAPQAWAWKARRVKTLQASVHTLFTILPFEKQWFVARGLTNVKALAHPIWQRFQQHFQIPRPPCDYHQSYQQLRNHPTILLLPGSRQHEVKYLLPIFLQVIKTLRAQMPIRLELVKASHLDDKNFVIAADQVDHFYRDDELVIALQRADCCLAASGTVTLTTALFQVPTLVCYQSSLLNELIYYLFVSYRGPISLCNIVHNRLVFPEFVQEFCNERLLTSALKKWIEDENEFVRIKNILEKTKDLIQGEGLDLPEYLAQVIKDNYHEDPT